MTKCIFLDRDGVINKERGDHTYLVNDFVFNDGLFEALQQLQKKGYIFIVITNQSGIALGKYTVEQMEACHQIFLTECAVHQIKINAIYYCPHYPTISNCLCRKPNSLLLEKAISKYHININASYFIGDKERDIEASQKAGVKGILIESNQNLSSILHLIS